MELTFAGELWRWEGPAPWYFVTVPQAESELIHDASELVTYGWGMIPVTVTIGATTWATSLWPKDGRYVVPIKVAVRRAEGLDEGVRAEVRLRVTIDR